MKKSKFYKKIIALLLGTTITLTPSCAKTTEKEKTKDNNTQQKIAIEEHTLEIFKEKDEKQAEKTKRKKTENNETTEETIEEITEIMIEDNIQEQTTAEKERTNTNNNNNNCENYIQSTYTSTSQSYENHEKKCEERTTTKANNSNTSRLTTTKAVQQQEEKTTKKSDKTTTKETTTKRTTITPVVTTVATTTTVAPTEFATEAPTYFVIRNDYNKNDILSPIKLESQYALYQLSDELRKELFNGYVHENQYGGSLGADQSMALIVALNYNQDLNMEALDYIYQYNTEEEFKQYCDNIDLAYYQYLYGSTVDFNKYVIDQSLANELNNISESFKKYMDGTNETFDETVMNYIENNQSNNYIINYLMYSTYNRINSTQLDLYETQQQYFENIITPTFKKIKGRQYK